MHNLKRTLRGWSVPVLSSVSGVFLLIGEVMFVISFLSITPPISSSPIRNPVTYKDGVLTIKTLLESDREMNVDIVRELRMEADDAVVQITLPTTRVAMKKGGQLKQWLVSLPDLPPGNYILHNSVCWADDAVHVGCKKLNSYPLEYVNGNR